MQAFLFDLDGTLTDTDPFHFAAWQQVMKDRDRSIDSDFYRDRIAGRTNDDCGKLLFPDYSATQRDSLGSEKEACYRKLVTNIAPTPGLPELLAWAKDQAVRLALVTNAPRDNCALLINSLGLADSFEVVVLGEELARSKPDPLPYVTAMSRLSVVPEQAVAFEDSIPGVVSAKGSGAVTVALSTTQCEISLYEAGADLVIADFTDARLYALLTDSAGITKDD